MASSTEDAVSYDEFRDPTMDGGKTSTHDDEEDFETEEHEDMEPQVAITIYHHGKAAQLSFPEAATLSDLSEHLTSALSIPPSNQKFLITPKVGLVKPPFALDHSLSALADKKIVFMGSTPAEISSLQSTISRGTASATRRRAGPIKSARPARTRNPLKNSQYTFQTLRPLPYLPRPERSLAFLERLRDDRGIRAAMAKWKWSVPLLTEMNPAEHTTEQSRTLGLNRNQGEVIELRLRTDAYDGYRDYRTIRKTLCHELAHNVFGPHDRKFYDLMKQIEQVVDREDGVTGARTLSGERIHMPPGGVQSYEEEDDHFDGGGWTGGDYVVGGRPAGAGIDESVGISRRDIIARATEERLKKAREERGEPSSGSGSGS
jgi:hypothetical protein